LYLPQYYYTPNTGSPPNGEGALNSVTEYGKTLLVWDFIKVIEPEAPIDKDVKILVHFVEIAKKFEKSFGFSWAPSLDSSGSNINMNYTYDSSAASNNQDTAKTLTTITGIINNFIPKLNNALNHNKGRVLQSAAITIRNNTEGTIKKTTSIPYKTTVNGQASTANAEIGMELKIKPELIGTANDISLGISVAVKQIVSQTVNGPIVSGDNVSTNIMIKSSDTAAIGGLIQNTSSTSYGTGGSDPNVIVSLSKSKDFQKDKSQFVMFVTPEIIDTAKKGSEALSKKFKIDASSKPTN
jgi:pilus assembly protein CpaC